MKEILVINGSASENSSNKKLIDNIARLTKGIFRLALFDELKSLPHFDPELSTEGTPKVISDFRQRIQAADGILICTPEYVFSIPSGLKNAIEWCVATTVFSGKPTGIITASAGGEKAHQDLQLIMKTVMADLRPDTLLLIQGVKSKINDQGRITDDKTEADLVRFLDAYENLVNS